MDRQKELGELAAAAISALDNRLPILRRMLPADGALGRAAEAERDVAGTLAA
jgi:hypothetical protein